MKNLKSKHTRIKETSGTRNNNLVFSFKYLKITDKFCITKYDNLGDIKSFIDRLKNLCLNNVMSIKLSRSKSLRVHPIDFSAKNVSEDSFGIINEDQIVGESAYQIQISTNKGRIHGFFTGSIFNIVWIDPEHKLYNKKKGKN